MPPDAGRPRLNSLYVRLIVGASAWSLVALVAAGLILTELYRQNVETAFDERLGVYLKTLIGEFAAQAPEPLSDPGNLGEQRFEQLFSGWYWQVRSGVAGPVVLASGSLFTDTLDFPDLLPERLGNVSRGTINRADGQRLRILQQHVTFPADRAGGTRQYEILVAADSQTLSQQIADFRFRVVLTLAVFGFGLVAATIFQVRWGLRPLERVRRGLAEVRSGKEAHLTGSFPAEIAPLARELNALLDSNREVVDRARTQVGNLAHALKTPLSVITNESRSTAGPLADKVAEQAEIMRRQVTHYLDRARIAARSTVIGSVTETAPAVGRLTRAMERIYGPKGIAIRIRVDAGARFGGEQQDLEEMVGNLIDNACKWAKSEVEVAVDYTAPSDGAPGRLTITIDDDGPGLTPEECRAATRRGQRLDETKPGSGLGLSIVTDLVGLYGGRFSLARSPRGGLRAMVDLPAA